MGESDDNDNDDDHHSDDNDDDDVVVWIVCWYGCSCHFSFPHLCNTD